MDETWVELGAGMVEVTVEVMVLDSTIQRHNRRKPHGEENPNILVGSRENGVDRDEEMEEMVRVKEYQCFTREINA